MTRRKQGAEARHVAIRFNLVSPPCTDFCLYTYLQWASTVRFQISGLVTLMASWEKISSLRISHSLWFIQHHFEFYKARRLIQVTTSACLCFLTRSPYFFLSFNKIPILSLLVYDAVHFSKHVATLLRILLPLSWRLKSIWWRVSILERVLKSVWNAVLLRT